MKVDVESIKEARWVTWLMLLFGFIVVCGTLGARFLILATEEPSARLVRVEEAAPPVADPLLLESPDNGERLMQKTVPETATWPRLRAAGFDPDQTSAVTAETK